MLNCSTITVEGPYLINHSSLAVVEDMAIVISKVVEIVVKVTSKLDFTAVIKCCFGKYC